MLKASANLKMVASTGKVSSMKLALWKTKNRGKVTTACVAVLVVVCLGFGFLMTDATDATDVVPATDVIDVN